MTFIDKIFDTVDTKELIGLNNELKSIYIYEKFKNSNNSVILVTSNLHEAGLIYNSLTHYTDKVWFFPMDDFITSEAIAVSPEFKITRLETMNSVIDEEKAIIITNLMGYLRFLPTKELWKKSSISLSVSTNVSKNSIVEKLDKIGYERNDLVTKTGEYANRGYILDVFPFGFEKPVRIEFFDDEIEEIRYFEPDTQLSLTNLSSLEILPFTEFIN